MTDRSDETGHPVIGQMFTCDACSENDTPIAKVEPDTEAYICQRCVEREEQALAAAAEVIATSIAKGERIVIYNLTKRAIDAYWQALNAAGFGSRGGTDG